MKPGALWSWLRRKAWQDSRFARQAVRDCFRRTRAPDHRPRPGTWPDDGLRVAWLGHATFLIRLGTATILTDPVLGGRVGPRCGPFTLGPKRYVAPALTVDRLPPPDVVLISHAHFDHLDRPSLNRLKRIGRIIAPVGTRDLIPVRHDAATQELGWHEPLSFAAGGGATFRITAFPVAHPPSRWRFDTGRTCNGYLVEAGGKRLFFIGDTAFGQYEEIGHRLGPADVALLPIGGYDPFLHNHCTPEQALEIAVALGATLVIPHQHATFALSREPLSEPIARFKAAAIPRTGLRKAPLVIGQDIPVA